MPKVYNKYHGDAPPDAVYIGRPSKWGNPFVIMESITRKESIEMFKKYLNENPKLINDIKKELKGKDLICFCAPKACHGDILLEIANKE